MAIKKSEIYNDLWKSCDELRGGMDASQYKDYILSILFVKYISDKYAGKADSLVTIPEDASFQDMVDLKGTDGIGGGINDILKKIAEANDMHGIIDVEDIDFDDDEKLGSGKAKVDRLSKLIGIFQRKELDFSKNRAEGDDIIGDAYEYLMRNFATQSGKSKGQFYTPSEVSQIIAKIIGAKNAKRKDWTVYDPTAGSGSLLLKVANETPNGITIYGQENDVATRAMAMMNMWIHNYVLAEIERENTIASPKFINKDGTLKEFDFVVSNPPFSFKSWDTGIDSDNDKFGRFDDYGIPPKKNGDFAFLLHLIKSLKNTGKGAIILPHGVLFRGNTEAEIRKKIIKSGIIKAIIGLPSNLFFGTGIPACILLLDKENAQSRKGIFIIDASKEFVKNGNKNRLRARDIHKIVDTFEKQLEIPKYSRLVSFSEISDKNEYNLNITRYVDNQEKDDYQDIEAHLKGGIPTSNIDEMDYFWNVCPKLRNSLFSSINRDGYEKLNINKSKVKEIIFENSEFKKVLDKIEKSYVEWKVKHKDLLNEFKIKTSPKETITIISEDILEKFKKIELINHYDVYQNLMAYWEDIMQDDMYLISQNGWDAGIFPIKDKNDEETGWDSELLPKNIIIEKFFEKENKELDEIQSKVDEINQKMELMDEENEGKDEDFFSEARSDSDKITKNMILKRIKDIEKDPEFIEELNVLEKYRELLKNSAELKKQLKSQEKKLDENLFKKYKTLTKLEIKEIVIEDKWFFTIKNLLDKEMEKISQNLSRRIIELVERYEITLPSLIKETETYSYKIHNHLKKMGFQW
jgi:type I restriction enzyme M protein